MSISVQVKGAKETQARLARASASYDQIAQSAVRMASILMRRKLVQRMTGKFAGRDPFWGKRSPAGAYLGARSGQTRVRLSPGGVVFRRGDTWTSTVGSPDPHVRLHEHGGIVRGGSPKGFLRIPTAVMQTPAGVDRLTGQSAKALGNTFFLRSKAGNLWIATRGRRKELVLLYLLRRFATYRPRGIFAAVHQEMQAEFARIGALNMQTLVRQAGGA